MNVILTNDGNRPEAQDIKGETTDHHKYESFID